MCRKQHVPSPGRNGKTIFLINDSIHFNLPTIAMSTYQANFCGIEMCSHISNADQACRNSIAPLVKGHQYYGLIPLARSMGIQAYYFTVLRHPLSRIPSLYRYIKKSIGHRLYHQVKNMSLVEFVDGESVASNGMTQMLCGKRHDAKCSVDHDYAIETAKKHLFDDFAFVGLQECYKESTAKISRLLQWVPATGGLKALNENRGQAASPQSSAPALSWEQADRILHRNDWDVELYEFGLRLFRASLSAPSNKEKDGMGSKGRKKRLRDSLIRRPEMECDLTGLRMTPYRKYAIEKSKAKVRQKGTWDPDPEAQPVYI